MPVSLPEEDEGILCPPDRSIPIDWLRLKQALLQEVAASGTATADDPGQQQHLFTELLSLLEVLTHVQYVQESKYLQSSMVHVQPQLTGAEQRMLLFDGAGGQQEIAAVDQQLHVCDQELLDRVIELLLRARYMPLTKEEWDIAQHQEFTFDIPVRIDWDVLDPGLFNPLWNRQQPHQETGGHSSNRTNSFSASGIMAAAKDKLKRLRHGQTADLHHHQQHAAASPLTSRSPPSSALLLGTSLDRELLPEFSDRLLVFHRGVGVATAPGMYLTQKVDMLFDYLLVQPAAALARSLSAMGQQQQQEQQQDMPQLPVPNAAPDVKAGRMVALASVADEDVPAAARLVVRRSLRSLMPGPRQVLERFWDPLVLQEPTYRSVVVVYRTATSPASLGPGGSEAKAAESAVTAALYAGAGDWLAADAAMEGLQAAAEAQQSADEAAAGGKAAPSRRQAARAAAKAARAAAKLRDNPHNINIKSFADVAVADLEMVMPSKQVQVQAITIVRSALAALGALGALVALVAQQEQNSFQWSLAVLPALGLVAARAIKVLTTIKSHQAALTSTMLSMAYNAARDSQEGVLCKLVDELRDSHAKEAALAVTALITNCWRQDRIAGAAAAAASINRGSESFHLAEIDAACEAFLLRRFGVQVDFILDDTLGLLLQWGLIRDVGGGRYQLTPLRQAVNHLQQQSLMQGLGSNMQHHQQQQQQQGPGLGRTMPATAAAAAAATLAAAADIATVNKDEPSLVSSGGSSSSSVASRLSTMAVGGLRQQDWVGAWPCEHLPCSQLQHQQHGRAGPSRSHRVPAAPRVPISYVRHKASRAPAAGSCLAMRSVLGC